MPETKIPSIYRVPSKTEPELKRYLESVQEAIEVRLGRRGDELDQAVTFRDLIDSNLAAASNRLNRVIGPIVENPTPSMPFLTVPQNVQASCAFTKIMVTWDNHQMGSLFARAEIWRSGTDNLAAATLQASVYGSVWTDSVDYNTTMYYWVRFVQKATEVGADETFGAFSDPSASCTTAEDIGAVMTALSEELANLPGYGTLIGTTVPNLITTANSAFTHVIKSDSEPSTRDDNTALQQGDIWADTNDNNQLYVRNAANNAWVKARDGTLVTLVNAQANTISGHTSSIATNVTDIATVTTANSSLSTTVTSLSGTVNTKNQTFVATSAPTAIVAGDLWIDSDDNNKLYRATGAGTGNWVALPPSTTNTFAQDGIPTSITIGDLWIDTNDSNKMYRANAVGVSAIVTSGNGWYLLDDTRIAANATAVSNLSTAVGLSSASSTKIVALESTVNNGSTGVAANAVAVGVLNTSVGLSGAEATKITALEASIGKVYGARVITTNDSNNVKVETMANVASSTTTATHGISAADVTAGVFISLKNTVATGGLTTQQLNKTFKVTARVNTTQLQIETVGTAATSAATSVTVVDGGTIGANAGLAQLATVTADIEGNAHSSYVLQVSANGSVAGMVIEANAEAGGTASAVQFVADKFAIWNGVPTTTVRDFVANGSNVDTTNNTILLDVADYNALYLTTAVVYNNGGGTSIGGLTSDTVYYVIKGTSPKIKLALTETLATAGTAISLSSTGSGTHTVNNVTSAPFIVSNGNVYIDTVRIQDAAIIGAKLADATIETAHIFDLNADKIRAGNLNASARITVGSDGTGATDQRIEINPQYNRIVVVDDSS